MASDGQAPICGLDGNPDLTGLGIRAAFYIQSVTFAVAGEFLHQEAAFLHSSAIVLLLAILVALVRETIMGSLHAPEVAVIMWLFAVQIVASGQTFVKSTSVMRATMGIPPPTADLARIRIHLSVVFAYVGYATWFWFAGLDTLPRTPCEEYGFFFTKVDIRGWFRTVNKVVYSLICVFTGLYAAFIALAWIYYGIERAVAALKGQGQKATQKNVAPVPGRGERMAEDDLQISDLSFFESQATLAAAVQQLPRAQFFAVSSSFLVIAALKSAIYLALMVPSAELQIRWNQIRGVQALDSVGQLVPFIMALGQFVHVAYSTIRGKGYADLRIEENTKTLGNTPSCPKRGIHPDEEQHELLSSSIEESSLPKVGALKESVNISYHSTQESLLQTHDSDGQANS